MAASTLLLSFAYKVLSVFWEINHIPQCFFFHLKFFLCKGSLTVKIRKKNDQILGLFGLKRKRKNTKNKSKRIFILAAAIFFYFYFYFFSLFFWWIWFNFLNKVYTLRTTLTAPVEKQGVQHYIVRREENFNSSE